MLPVYTCIQKTVYNTPCQMNSCKGTVLTFSPSLHQMFHHVRDGLSPTERFPVSCVQLTMENFLTVQRVSLHSDVFFMDVWSSRFSICSVFHEPLGEPFYYGPERMSNRFTAEQRPEDFSKFKNLTFEKVRYVKLGQVWLVKSIAMLTDH